MERPLAVELPESRVYLLGGQGISGSVLAQVLRRACARGSELAVGQPPDGLALQDPIRGAWRIEVTFEDVPASSSFVELHRIVAAGGGGSADCALIAIDLGSLSSLEAAQERVQWVSTLGIGVTLVLGLQPSAGRQREVSRAQLEALGDEVSAVQPAHFEISPCGLHADLLLDVLAVRLAWARRATAEPPQPSFPTSWSPKERSSERGWLAPEAANGELLDAKVPRQGIAVGRAARPAARAVNVYRMQAGGQLSSARRPEQRRAVTRRVDGAARQPAQGRRSPRTAAGSHSARGPASARPMNPGETIRLYTLDGADPAAAANMGTCQKEGRTARGISPSSQQLLRTDHGSARDAGDFQEQEDTAQSRVCIVALDAAASDAGEARPPQAVAIEAASTSIHDLPVGSSGSLQDLADDPARLLFEVELELGEGRVAPIRVHANSQLELLAAEVAENHGLTQDEEQRICAYLRRVDRGLVGRHSARHGPSPDAHG